MIHVDGDAVLTFKPSENTDEFVDNETGSVWTGPVTGRSDSARSAGSCPLLAPGLRSAAISLSSHGKAVAVELVLISREVMAASVVRVA